MSSDNFSNGRNNSGRPSSGGFPGESARPRRSNPPPVKFSEGMQSNNPYQQGRPTSNRPPERQRSNNHSQQGRPTSNRPMQSRQEPNGRYSDERPSRNRRNSPPQMNQQMPRNTRKRKVKIVPIVIIAIIIIALATVGILFAMYNNSLKPVDPSNTSTVMFEVADGSTTGIIAADLEDRGLIRNATFFKMRTKNTGYDGELKPGGFILSKSMSTDEIIQALLEEGANFTDVEHFTIPEGLTLRQTMASLVADGLVTEEDFMNEVVNGEFDYKFMEYLPAGENRLEGFLYPNTYEVFANASAHDIIDTMLAQFDASFTDEHYALAKNINMNILEVVTMASLIERETMVDEERPRVAGVIFNRLKKDMMLQIDATIQFILPEVKESLLYSDLEVDSPYNTYKNFGLPPGPICSPRIESINAVLNPEVHDYIFYVLDPALDGTHRFSASASEFEDNKALYYEALEARDNG